MSRQLKPAKKTQFSFRRTVLPPLLGVLVMVGVLGLINGQWVTAQLYYRFSQPEAVEAVPVAGLQLDPNATPEISVPAIKVKAPVIFEPSYQESQVQLALRNGVVKFATTADPGQPGNVVIFGHSSGQPWAPGDYKFIFTNLDKLRPGDKIYLDYKGQRYIYQMTDSVVVMPQEVSVLNPTDTPTLTLITCTPVGTNQKRLVVRAQQISPKPAATVSGQAADTKPSPSTGSAHDGAQSLPDGDQTTLWESIRGLIR